ncbi:flavin-containing monooxygenase [Shewanella acanthi]|uniref:flavin-containing monooxygenase n=1 Tax=Shewanella acanthi TaxID=2864212 RepID=UPI001C6572C0|nr:NAD(P)/FAD-dependent oxidoreductase [Shewanella acanthi]QYJ78249.1 NAD(P)/FAD-dependent oxidoreductase [Shewanella acanthi]
MDSKHYDTIIIGAGLSGIGMACRLVTEHPNKNFAILERRQKMGGTWDLFRYPGIRSDSDMASFGFDFKPWYSDKVLAEGTNIRNYVIETAKEFRFDEKVQYGFAIIKADWSDATQRWTLTARHEATGQEKLFSCAFLINCAGYYNFDQGYRPHFEGEESFKGQIVHPQFWPENIDYSGKRVIVIGSGATAITLVPSMADKAANVTMLQRSPSYIMSVPSVDKISMMLNRILPKKWVFDFARKRNILLQRGLYLACRKWPNMMRKRLLSHVQKQVGPNVDMRHFSPQYNPWEQRLCAAPDGDFFTALRSGKANIVTDHIECFTEKGIRLKSGQHLDADVIVTATGLEMQLMGGMAFSVNGAQVNVPERMIYKGIMIEGLPNYGWIFGYTNAPWTLKADIGGRYLCNLFSHMQKNGYAVAKAIDTANNNTGVSMIEGFAPGYMARATARMPRQGKAGPWQVTMHYGKDKKILTEDAIEDGILQFTSAHQSAKQVVEDLKAIA